MTFEDDQSKTARKNQQKEERRLQAQKKKDRARVQKLEEEIDALENQLEEIDQALSDPEIYEDVDRAFALSKDRAQVEEDLNQKMEAWMDLSQ